MVEEKRTQIHHKQIDIEKLDTKRKEKNTKKKLKKKYLAETSIGDPQEQWDHIINACLGAGKESSEKHQNLRNLKTKF